MAKRQEKLTPTFEQQKMIVDASGIHPTDQPASPIEHNDDLETLAELQANCERITRRKQYNEQKITDYQKRIAETSSEQEIALLKISIQAHEKELEQLEQQWDITQQEIKDLSESLIRKKHYDKYTVFRNVRHLLANSKIKLGQIEREASGCQPGYMSRLEKPDNTTEPSLEFIVTVASKLGISTELLVRTDLTQITNTEQYLIDFLKKLERDTADDKLAWNTESAYDLNNMAFSENMTSPHDLFDLYSEEFQAETDNEPYTLPVLRFTSHNYEGNTIIAGNCYNLRMKNNTTLYIMDVEEREQTQKNIQGRRSLEVWMYQRGKGRSFICSTKDIDLIRITVINLYKCLEEWANHPHIKEHLKTVIDDFMNDDFTGI